MSRLPRPRLFVLSALALFIELALIRWLGCEVRIFAYFKNLILIASSSGHIQALVNAPPASKSRYFTNDVLDQNRYANASITRFDSARWSSPDQAHRRRSRSLGTRSIR